MPVSAGALRLLEREDYMAGRSSTSYQKRQKELARQDKQRAKAARREQRKLERQDRPPGLPAIEPLEPEFFDAGEATSEK